MNLDNMVDPTDLVKKEFKKIFFYRICGTGMGATACLLKEAGYDVSGCDVSFSPPMSTYLESIGIPCLDIKNVDETKLKEYDLIIVGNSVPRNSEHAKLIEECGVAFTSFPSVMGNLILKNREVIGVAGTHGKTTTTYFLTQLLERLGDEPGYFVGGIINERPPAKLGKSKFFVIESDEYDSAYFQKYAKFQQYELNHMILTSLEFDHADIYNSVEEIEEQFIQTLDRIKNPIVIANESYQSIKKLASSNWILYSETFSTGPQIISQSLKGTEFKLKLNDNWNTIHTNLVGTHNILNLSSCILLLNQLGFESEKIINACADLGMVKRRQEIRGEYKGSIVIDDFAHHPRAITLTMEAIRTLFPGKEILTIFEPISATSRSDIFQNEFSESLQNSDRFIIAKNPLNTSVKGHDNLNCQKIVDEAIANKIPAKWVDNLTDLQNSIDEWIKEDQVLLILSNRTCLGLWESKFVDQIK